MRARLLAWTAAALLAPALFAGCPGEGGGGPTTGEAYDEVQARGKLVVASDVKYPPFEYLQEDGSYAGFDIELVREVAQDLGVDVEIKNIPFARCDEALRSGEVDAIFSGMSITPARREEVAFSQPYFHVGQVFLKRKGDDRFASWEDLNAEGVTVAVEEETTGAEAVREKMPRAERRPFARVQEAAQAVIDGEADAVVFDHPFLQDCAREHADALEGVWEPFTQEPIAAAVRKDSPRLLAAIDGTLDRLQESGELEQLSFEYFPAPPSAAPTGGGDDGGDDADGVAASDEQEDRPTGAEQPGGD